MFDSPRRTLQWAAASLLFLSAIPVARADCFVDSFGTETCTGITGAARAGIGAGIFIFAMLIIFLVGMARRRRMLRHNQTYINNNNNNTQQTHVPVYNGNVSAPQGYPPPGNYGGPQGYPPVGNYAGQDYNPTNAAQAPQYPPQTHVGGPFDGHNPPVGYDAQPYSQQPQALPPPQMYVPPQSRVPLNPPGYDYAAPLGPPPMKD